eukprot:762537-Hanusia_phi.AAC.1
MGIGPRRGAARRVTRRPVRSVRPPERTAAPARGAAAAAWHCGNLKPLRAERPGASDPGRAPAGRGPAGPGAPRPVTSPGTGVTLNTDTVPGPRPERVRPQAPCDCDRRPRSTVQVKSPIGVREFLADRDGRGTQTVLLTSETTGPSSQLPNPGRRVPSQSGVRAGLNRQSRRSPGTAGVTTVCVVTCSTMIIQLEPSAGRRTECSAGQRRTVRSPSAAPGRFRRRAKFQV